MWVASTNEPVCPKNARANKLKSSVFVRNVSLLAFGSFVAQGITILSAPIQTRLYSPENFANFGIFTVIISALAPAVGGRYEVASVVVKEEKEGFGLYALSMWTALLLSAFLFLVFTIWQQELTQLLGAQSLGLWWFMLPFAILISALNSCVKYFENRRKNYKLITKVLIIQSGVVSLCSIALGVGNFATVGLIVSMLLGTLTGILLLLRASLANFSGQSFLLDKEKICLAKKYARFPMHEATTSLLNGVQAALPIFFLAKFYPEAIAGFYVLLIKVTMSPLGIISTAVSEVHLRKTAEVIQSRGDATRYFVHLCVYLGLIVAIPSLIVITSAPQLFELFFGVRWRQAGTLLAILMPALALRFIASTVSGAITASGNTHLGAYWKIFAFVVTFTMFWLAAGKLSVEALFWLFMLTDSLIYVTYLIISAYSIRRPRFV